MAGTPFLKRSETFLTIFLHPSTTRLLATPSLFTPPALSDGITSNPISTRHNHHSSSISHIYSIWLAEKANLSAERARPRRLRGKPRNRTAQRLAYRLVSWLFILIIAREQVSWMCGCCGKPKGCSRSDVKSARSRRYSSSAASMNEDKYFSVRSKMVLVLRRRVMFR